MSMGGWETVILWLGILALALNGARVGREHFSRPHSRDIGMPVVWGGLIIPGLIVIWLFLLLTDACALIIGGILTSLLLLGSVAIWGGSDR